MPIFGVAITKEVPYRFGVEEFSNVYHYEVPAGDSFADADVVQLLQNAEGGVLASNVTFRTGRTWGPVGDPLTSVTREIIDLVGTGGLGVPAGISPERAILLQWWAGRSEITGRKVYLRKWMHAPGEGNPGEWSDAVIQEQEGLPVAIETRYNDYAAAVREITIGTNAPVQLCSAAGRKPVEPAVVFPFLEHRNFH